MNELNAKIAAGFEVRSKPVELVSSSTTADCDKTDAICLGKYSWQELTWDCWTTHHAAFFAFRPDAFQYYLPSILTLSLERPEHWFFPADHLISILDRSPTIAYWDDFLTERLLGLAAKEYEVLLQWLLTVAPYGVLADASVFERASTTICLLQHETLRCTARKKISEPASTDGITLHR